MPVKSPKTIRQEQFQAFCDNHMPAILERSKIAADKAKPQMDTKSKRGRKPIDKQSKSIPMGVVVTRYQADPCIWTGSLVTPEGNRYTCLWEQCDPPSEADICNEFYYRRENFRFFNVISPADMVIFLKQINRKGKQTDA